MNEVIDIVKEQGLDHRHNDIEDAIKQLRLQVRDLQDRVVRLEGRKRPTSPRGANVGKVGA